ncbi:MAG: sigma-70 family RNA polymerase sigma factor [Deltaproteobacteria bacterium]|nr:sigma-70 family RNA polymerase sigma factor [Deltaproteobacteria bacterium]
MSETNAAAEIAAGYHRGLYHFALALCRGDRQEALGIVQQTYLEVLEGRADLASAKNPRAFLFGVARNVARSRRRRRSIWGRIVGLKPLELQAPLISTDPEGAATNDERIARLRSMLKLLPDRQREVVALVFGDDLTVEEAAEAMGVSVGSARTHYHRAKKKLRQLLSEGNDDHR